MQTSGLYQVQKTWETPNGKMMAHQRDLEQLQSAFGKEIILFRPEVPVENGYTMISELCKRRQLNR